MLQALTCNFITQVYPKKSPYWLFDIYNLTLTKTRIGIVIRYAETMNIFKRLVVSVHVIAD